MFVSKTLKKIKSRLFFHIYKIMRQRKNTQKINYRQKSIMNKNLIKKKFRIIAKNIDIILRV